MISRLNKRGRGMQANVLRLLFWLGCLVFAGYFFSGCTKNKEVVEEKPEEKPVEDPGPTTPFGLQWGEFEKHPAYQAAESCHRVDTIDLNLLEFLGGARSESDLLDVAKMLGESVDPDADDFEKRRAFEKINEKVEARVSAMRYKQLCVEYQVGLQEYNFESEYFSFSDSKMALMPFDDLRASALEYVGRLEDATGTRRPEGYQPVAAATFGPLPSLLFMSKEKAEAFSRQLIKSPKANGDASEEKESGRNQGEAAGRASKRRAFARLSPEVRAAMEGGGAAEPTVSESAAKNDRPVGEIFDELRDELRTPGAAGDARALFIFSFADARRVDPSNQVPGSRSQKNSGVRVADNHLHYLILSNARGDVVRISPESTNWDSEDGALGELTPAAHMDSPRDFEKVCDKGGLSKKTRTIFRDGELVDLSKWVCSRCPSGSEGGYGSATIDSYILGSFSAPGIREMLVHTDGCESLANGEGGLTLLRELATGDLARVSYVGTEFDDPLVVRDPAGQDLVFMSFIESRDITSGAFTQLKFGQNGVFFEEVFPIYDNLGACSERYIAVEPGKPTRTDLDGDGVDDLIFTVELSQGVRDFETCERPDDAAPDTTETVTLRFLVRPGELQVADESKADLERIQKLVGER